MKLREGDTVKVIKANVMHSHLMGKVGTVKAVAETAQVASVNFEWDEGFGVKQGVLTSLWWEELELVESAHEKEQVEKIAETLYTEGGFGETLDSLREIAANLYRAGVRHDG